ncbi:hypothetical protein FHR33_009882 [Nonomuraea dietziae]|uniref:Uncharacterized protein n=1 Tax=Nonomuraea dietziae TaxID=65515 RepID=A0A7W5YUQ4_9ACTN|nr:hypothetical protein [Nonomuraea dietziae]
MLGRTYDERNISAWRAHTHAVVDSTIVRGICDLNGAASPKRSH